MEKRRGEEKRKCVAAKKRESPQAAYFSRSQTDNSSTQTDSSLPLPRRLSSPFLPSSDSLLFSSSTDERLELRDVRHHDLGRRFLREMEGVRVSAVSEGKTGKERGDRRDEVGEEKRERQRTKTKRPPRAIA